MIAALSVLPLRISSRVVEDSSGCWIWTGASREGYGRVGVRGANRLVHRVVFSAIVGDVPENLTIDHLCRNQLCCNPAHLEVCTRGENSRRAHNANRKMVCRRGHQRTMMGGALAPCAECCSSRKRAGYAALDGESRAEFRAASTARVKAYRAKVRVVRDALSISWADAAAMVTTPDGPLWSGRAHSHSGDNLNNLGPSGLGCAPNPAAVVSPRVAVGGGDLGSVGGAA